jgi:flagellar motor switch protein FliG
MMADKGSLEKAAVVIAALGPQAESLLAQLPPAVAEELRRQAAKVQWSNSEEELQILEEFLVATGRLPSPFGSSPACSLLNGGANPTETKKPGHFGGQGYSSSSRQPADRKPATPAEPRNLSDRKGLLPEGTNTTGNRSSSFPPGSTEDLYRSYSAAGGNPWVSSAEAGPPRSRPFERLQNSEATTLAQILSSERPQVIALVLSHLPPEQAGQVLAKFPPGLQVEILHRLIDLEETDGEILREIERALELRLNQLVQAGRRRRAGLSAVRNIVEAADRHTRGQILGSLQLFDRDLAQQLAPPIPEFEDLAFLDDLSLRELVAAAEPLVLQLALVGASDSFLRRVMAVLPPQERTLLKERIEELGPTALRDIDEARHRLCELAQQLVAAGQIDLPLRVAVTLSG